MSKVVPEGWTYDELGKYISESVAGEWGTEAVGDENDIPVIRSTNFTSSGVIDYSNLAYRNIDERKRLAKSLKSGDMVLEKSGGSPTQPVGRVVYFDKNEPFLFSNFTQKLTPKPDCDSKFLFYKFYSEYQNGTVLKFQQQTTGIINFQLAEYLRFKSIFPPLSEQQKIATILSSVDNVIEKTRAQIDKLKDLKTGMMQELLTKGIGHTEFKDSPVGRIPAEWSVQKIDSLVTKVGSGVTPRGGSEAYVSSGIPLIRSQNVYSDGLRLEDIAYITVEQHQKMANSQLKPNDVLLNITGASIGRCYYLPRDFKEGNVNQHVCIIRPKQSVINSVFLAYLLNSEIGQHQIMSLQAGGNREGLNFQQIREICFATPTLPEQQKIVNLLQSIDTKIMTVSQKLISVEQTKKALMQDLLTGKVRVKLGC